MGTILIGAGVFLAFSLPMVSQTAGPADCVSVSGSPISVTVSDALEERIDQQHWQLSNTCASDVLVRVRSTPTSVPSETTAAHLHSTVVLDGTVLLDAGWDRAAASLATVRVPARSSQTYNIATWVDAAPDHAAGTYTIDVAFDWIPAPPETGSLLSATGSDVWPTVAVAGLVLSLGVAACALSRKRRTLHRAQTTKETHED